ncbi:MAG: hypothetical protein IKE15_11275 [Clostridia bacterium]|nr:hypothetical protein [Clostridia bacterium]
MGSIIELAETGTLGALCSEGLFSFWRMCYDGKNTVSIFAISVEKGNYFTGEIDSVSKTYQKERIKEK